MLQSILILICLLLHTQASGMAPAQTEIKKLIAKEHTETQAIIKEYVDNLSNAYTELYNARYCACEERTIITTAEEVEQLMAACLAKPQFSQSPVQEQTKTIIHRMFRTYHQESPVLTTFPLGCCACHPITERIQFTLQLLTDITTKFPDKNTPLVYTSLASGSLLHEYLIVQELIEAGYHAITINIIDLHYPEFTLLREYPTQRHYKRHAELKARAMLTGEEQRELDVLTHKITTDERLKQLPARLQEREQSKVHPLTELEQDKLNQFRDIQLIEDFHVRIEQLFFNKQTHTALQVRINFYNNALDYIARAQRITSEKTTVLTMIDPSSGLLKLPPAQAQFLSRANTFIIGHQGEHAQRLLIFLPLHASAQVYSNAEQAKLYNNYNSELLCVFKGLEQVLQKGHISASELYELLITCKEPGTLKTVPFTVLSQAHLLYQDILAYATTEDCIAYLMQHELGTDSGPRTITKIDRTTYPKENLMDVIAAHTGYTHRLL